MRTATSDQHQKLEERLDLLSPNLELGKLEEVVRTFAAFYGALEDRIDGVMTPALSKDIDWPSRKKSPTLLSDLALFGKGPAVGVSVPVPPIANDSEVLGVLYVIEGATLGGQLIGPHVGRLFPDHPVRIFSVYGDAAPQRWKAFRSVLNQRLINVEDLEQAKRSAVATFELLCNLHKQPVI